MGYPMICLHFVPPELIIYKSNSATMQRDRHPRLTDHCTICRQLRSLGILSQVALKWFPYSSSTEMASY